MATTFTGLNDIFKREYGAKNKKDWTPEDWARHINVTDEDLKKYPNAIIGTSPLMIALKEGNVEKMDMTRGMLDELYDSPNVLLSKLSKSKGK